jgi:hypothetical protein
MPWAGSSLPACITVVKLRRTPLTLSFYSYRVSRLVRCRWKLLDTRGHRAQGADLC